MSFLKVDGVTKVYQMGEIEVEALKGVDFAINEGEFVVILGPSGSGKSTLLNILGGMDMPTKGDVVLRGTSLTQLGEKGLTKFRRDHVGFVFQFYNLMANLTGKENVELATEICKNPLDIDKVLSDVGLADRSDHFPSQMSGGEQQRVAIARAVAKNPEVLLCDEPTGALDYTTGIKILQLLHQVNKDYHKTVMVITHNASIAAMADRVIKMRSGLVTENYINENPIDPEGIEW
ncbi:MULTISPECIES: ABC transporter ATP-binding protein [unclassified Fusibacter]|uniref:ABC transporter ATP-binding protein n=1 Tax=unclassified Fusibacter TaxID=2624464 RepID=UPI001011DE72|nr:MULTISPECIES: ABC transporter ATP-binding protein [unclassified Fusibacter]MCK8061022.1 ABC transporter ATP-binding protein [Fusibacter sp. A2]NPE20524.1 ABC transporter ATP-binding protein [Fusibacter sp. A1]RXV63722.1 ABC transporter ATP-binding protein [Fusibacter sp. A1]